MRKFYIIDRTNANFGKTIFDNAEGASVYMLGRVMEHYLIVKDDDNGARVVPIEHIRDVNVLREALERA